MEEPKQQKGIKKETAITFIDRVFPNESTGRKIDFIIAWYLGGEGYPLDFTQGRSNWIRRGLQKDLRKILER
jgi:hypothetical protein